MHSTDGLRRYQQRRIRQHAGAVHSYDFFNLLTAPELLDLIDGQLPSHRERLFAPIETLALFMGQALNPDASCQAAVNRHAVERLANGLKPCSTSTGAYCRARQRLPLALTQALVRQTGVLAQMRSPQRWQWQGRAVKLLDGSTVTMPDTRDNQARYPQQSNQKPGLGFPIARVGALVCLSSGAVLDTAMGPYSGKAGSEHALFQELLGSLDAGDVLIADRYYCSYVILALLQAQGVDAVFQQHQRRIIDFRRGQRLGAKDHLVVWEKPKLRPHWLSAQQYAVLPDTQVIREVQVKSKVLVTTLLSPAQTCKQALGQLYVQRWNVELDLRNIKTTLGLETLRCKTPHMNEKQWWISLLAYNLIRWLMLNSARLADALPRQLSFKHTLQLWLAWDRQCSWADLDPSSLLTLIAQQRVADRPGRIEPRALKRRLKPFPLLTLPRPLARRRIRLHGHPKKVK
jgi:hypothetical protein